MNKSYHLQLVTQMLALCTSAFGLVAALAWNTAIQSFINDYVKPYIPAGSTVVITQLIYAIIITVIVITVTIYLTRIKEELEKRSAPPTVIVEKTIKKLK